MASAPADSNNSRGAGNRRAAYGNGTNQMSTVALLARLEAKPGKEAEVEAMLRGSLAIAQAEPETVTWFALKLGPITFGIFDTFAAESGRQAHLGGEIAKALMAKAPELLAVPPVIEMVEILAEKSV